MVDVVATAKATLERFLGDLTAVTVSYDARPEVYDSTGVVRWVADVQTAGPSSFSAPAPTDHDMTAALDHDPAFVASTDRAAGNAAPSSSSASSPTPSGGGASV